MTEIRAFQPSDFSFAKGLTDLEGWARTLDDWESLYRLEPEGCFVAVEGDEPVGTVSAIAFKRTGWIHSLLVKPQWRNRGIGGELMAVAMDYLRKKGIRTIRLDAVQKAIPLYRRLGFLDEYWDARFLAESIPRAQPQRG